MFKINNANQRARMEIMMENMDTEDLGILINWGAELYRDGIITGIIAILGVVGCAKIIKKCKQR